MIEHFYAVIMAGGGGTRLWPLSRQARPKQMLRLNGDESLFQLAVKRLDGLFPPERILVVTVAEQAEKLKIQAPEIPSDNYLIEPMPRGTASVVGLAAVFLSHRDPQAVMAVLTADHFIDKVDEFQELLRAGMTVANRNYLVTLGIHPTYPATGYGYIQRGDCLEEFSDVQVFEVLRFKEKPALAQAKEMFASRDHDWNSGMFIWRVDRILDEFRLHMPVLSNQLKEIRSGLDSGEFNLTVQTVWSDIQPQTIDYGIMEKAEKVAVLPAPDLGWNDVGSWESLFDVLPADENGNIIIRAKSLDLDTRSSLICSDEQRRLIVTIGVEDLIIVDTGDALLVCKRDEAQKVREVVNTLKESNQSHYL